MAGPIEGFKTLPTGGKIAVGIGGIVVVYFIYRKYGSASTSASTPASPSAGSNIDPATGYAYGSAQDLAALSQGTATGYPVTSGGQTVGTTSGYGTNAQWAQAAEQGLASIGYSPTDVAAALGDYLTGTPVSAAYATIIRAAIAEYGPPPSGSYKIIPAPTKGPVTTGGGSGAGNTGNPAHPPVVVTGHPKKPRGQKPGTPSGVAASNVTSNGFTVAWHPVAGATSYRVRLTYQGTAVRQVTTSGTSVHIGGLTADHTFTTHVAARNAFGLSPETNGPTVHTLR